jgi:predicted nucleotidyltransferase
MITDSDKKIIEELARKFHAKRVVLFGSSLSPSWEYRDIDIGVEGIDGKCPYFYHIKKRENSCL